nr:hypothetical protein [Gemmatimonadaceae bacterium]
HGGDEIRGTDVTAVLSGTPRPRAAAPTGSGTASGTASATPTGTSTVAVDGLPEEPLSDALDAYEKQLITRALAAAAGNVAEAARRLKTDRPNLYRRMRRLGLYANGEE